MYLIHQMRDRSPKLIPTYLIFSIIILGLICIGDLCAISQKSFEFPYGENAYSTGFLMLGITFEYSTIGTEINSNKRKIARLQTEDQKGYYRTGITTAFMMEYVTTTLIFEAASKGCYD